MKAVTFSILENNVGYLKVSILPGRLGLAVARQIDSAVKALASCDRLILDLRGHLAGGQAVVRLMSYLTPEKLPITGADSLSEAKALLSDWHGPNTLTGNGKYCISNRR